MRLFALWLGLLSLTIHVPTHAAGKELVVGVQPYEPTRTLIAEHEKLAVHLRKSLNRPVRLVTAKDATAFGRRILAGDYELVIGAAHLVRLAQQDQGWHPLARYVPDTPVLLLARKKAENDTAAVAPRQNACDPRAEPPGEPGGGTLAGWPGFTGRTGFQRAGNRQPRRHGARAGKRKGGHGGRYPGQHVANPRRRSGTPAHRAGNRHDSTAGFCRRTLA